MRLFGLTATISFFFPRLGWGCGRRPQEEVIDPTGGKGHAAVGQTQLLLAGRGKRDQETEAGHPEAGTARLSATKRSWQESCPRGQGVARGGSSWSSSLPSMVQ